jgi:DNA-directed RNA polymerase specialized sigma24 family protein
MKKAPDLYWLAYLLTGREDVSIDIAADTASQDPPNPFFGFWMNGWSRRIVIAKALEAIRPELAESRRRTERTRVGRGTATPKDWSLRADVTKSQIEEALLAIDVFPRAAVVLSVFEGVHTPDAATLLDADVDLVKKAQAIGLREFTANLAGRKQHRVGGFSPMLALA